MDTIDLAVDKTAVKTTSRFEAIILAIRPKTLGAAVAPVLIGSTVAFSDRSFRWEYALFALLGALFIQIGTNLANDYYDFIQGADTPDRKGPTRVTQAGLFTPTQVKWGFIATFGLSAMVSIPLVLRGGWPVFIVGIASIASGILYTSGKKSLGYLGLGDIFVLFFFGPVAVGGTYYVQALSIPFFVVLIGFSTGLIATGILAVNNLRDVEQDKQANKRTLAVRFGRTFAKWEYFCCLVIPALIPAVIWFVYQRSPFVFLASLYLLPVIPTIKTVWTTQNSQELNKALARTGQFLMLYSILFSIGWVL